MKQSAREIKFDFWAFPYGSGFPLQSFCETQKGFPLQSLTQKRKIKI